MRIVPLGDQAVIAYPADEAAAVAVAAAVRAAAPPWLVDVVPAYASVGVYFDPDDVTTDYVICWMELVSSLPGRVFAISTPHCFEVPVCYDFAPDLPRVCDHTGLSADAVIALHTDTVFTVYAVGFVPGFPYLGYLPAALCGVPRLASPRVRVEAGSVGLTGRQTGIYPLPRPGGWNLIGRTPLTVVDVADGFFPLRVGDTVRFTRIDAAEFRRRDGERIDV